MKLSAFKLTRYLLVFTVVVLTTFGVGSLLRVNANPDRIFLYMFYAAAMFGDAAANSICIWLLNKRMKFAFHVSVTILVLNIIPTIFDQFGLIDLLFVLLNLFTLITLIIARKEFLPA